MVVQRKKFMFKINEFHGEQHDDNDIPKADINAYFVQNKWVQPDTKFAIRLRNLNLCLNLHKSEEELRNEMNRTTRYQINKGARDDLRLSYIHNPTNEEIKDFAVFFNSFATEKGIEECSISKLHDYRHQQMLMFSYVFNNRGKKLAAHAYIRAEKHVKMFHSCSGRFKHTDIPGTVVSRANRYMHWKNILYFKKQEFDMYDFMAISLDPSNESEQNVNRFKRGFGGEEIYEHESLIPQTWKGKLVIIVLRFLWRNRLEMVKPSQLKRMYMTSG